MDWRYSIFYPFSVYGQYHTSNMPLISKALATVARNGERSARFCIWKFRKKPIRALVSPKHHERAALFSMRLSIGIAGTFGGGYFAGISLDQDRPHYALATATAGVVSLTNGIFKTAVALDDNRNLFNAVNEAIEDHDSAKEFLVKTVEYSLTRRAVAGANVLANATWKDLSLAIEIADFCTRDIVNTRDRNRPKAIKDRRNAAIEISKLIEKTEVTHDNHELLLAIERAVRPRLHLGDRR